MLKHTEFSYLFYVNHIHIRNLLIVCPQNHSPRRRCGLTIRYIPTTTRITKDDWTTFLFRGNPVPGINTYSPIPAFRPGDHFQGDLPG